MLSIKSVTTVSQAPEMHQYYYYHKGREIGPVPLEILQELHDNGFLDENTMVKSESGNTWCSLSSVIFGESPDLIRTPEIKPPPPAVELLPPKDPPIRIDISADGKINREIFSRSPLLWRVFFALGLALVILLLLFLGANFLERKVNHREETSEAPPPRGERPSLEVQQKRDHLAQMNRILVSLRDFRSLRAEIREERFRQLEANLVRGRQIFQNEEVLEHYLEMADTLAEVRSVLAELSELERQLRQEREPRETFELRMARAEILDKLEILENSFASFENSFQDHLRRYSPR